MRPAALLSVRTEEEVAFRVSRLRNFEAVPKERLDRTVPKRCL